MPANHLLYRLISLCLCLSLSACDLLPDDTDPQLNHPATLLPEIAAAQRTPVSDSVITNLEAPIPAQCYTQTENRHNPCYTCHQMYTRNSSTMRMNELNDGGLQGAYIFSDDGLSNHWKNLFVDRRAWVDAISDETIQAYVNSDNYSQLASDLNARQWQGFIPDLHNYQQAAAAFDEQGFAKDGSHWVAFNYKPFLGTFWPTNGSTDDVVIRLPKALREVSGVYQRDMYLLNLSLVEMNIKQLERISIPTQDETTLGIDLNGDGLLGLTTELHQREFYLGDASSVKMVMQQYPENTELMHSVRYVGSDTQGAIFIPQRMKELRYMKKIRSLEQYDIASRYARERKEKKLEQLPSFIDHGERGMENGFGWLLQGFIEDYNGALRPQTHEETFFCMGCHAAVGTTIDQTFAFARKVTGAAGWGYINLKGMVDAPNVSEPGGEILHYLQRAGGGSEFRENPEMLARWFKDKGMVDVEKVRSADVYSLITPSPARALQLNKAYTNIVRSQSFIYGRDATWLPANNVFNSINEDLPPLAPEFRFYQWDIRLHWPDNR